MAVTLRHTEDVRRSYKRERGALCFEYQWAETVHVGCVLRVAYESCRIMSDVWGDRHFAIVWNEAEGRPENLTLDIIDYCGSYSDPVARSWYSWTSTAVVDATPEVVAAYEAYQAARREAETLGQFKLNLAEGERKAAEVCKGATVEVFKGRKVPVGTTGECIWVGDGRYGPRCGVRDEHGEAHWTALSNVRVVPGHEDWDNTCPDCGGASWIPAYDGNGGRVSCPECETRFLARENERVAREAEERKARKELKASGVSKGATVEVVAEGSRNDAPVGVTGKVFWVGANKFGPGKRVGFKAGGETYWAAAENVKAA
jgi:hypothetical protein